MGAVSEECASLYFSTSDILGRDRLPFWRELFSRQTVQVDIEPASDLPIDAVSLVSLKAMWAQTAIPVRFSRTAGMLGGGADSIARVVNLEGRASLIRDREPLEGLEAIGILHAEPAAMTWSSGAWMGLVVPRAALAPVIPKTERATMQLMPNSSDAIGLLVGYMDSLKERLPTMSAELRTLAGSHIHDLIALAFGPTSAGAAAALSGGVRAARLHSIKADILKNIGNHHDLTLANVAKRQRVTPRYIHMIFELEGISFSEYVLEQRLLRALHLMTDKRFADWKVTALASEAGFGDLSYFNRTFRRRFGMTPSEARKLHAERAWATRIDPALEKEPLE